MTAIEFNQQLILLQDTLRFFAKQLTHDDDDAQDLLQETFMKALSYKSYYREKSNLKAWLFTIMKNTFINQYRRKVRFNTLVDKTDEKHFINKTNKSDPNEPQTMLNLKEIEKEVGNLDDTYRKPFQMHCDGYMYKEIADKLEVPVGTIKSRIFQARKKLMNQLSSFAQ